MKKLFRKLFPAFLALLLACLCSCSTPTPAVSSDAPVSSTPPVSSAQPAPASSAPPVSSAQPEITRHRFMEEIQKLDILGSDQTLKLFVTTDGEYYLRTELNRYTLEDDNGKAYLPQDYLRFFDKADEALSRNPSDFPTVLLKMNFPEKMKLLSRDICVGESNKVYCIAGNIVGLSTDNIPRTPENLCIYREYQFEDDIVQVESIPWSPLDSFLVTAKGELYCIGAMTLYGGVNLATPEHFYKPIKVKTPGKVKKAIASTRTLYILCEDGMIYYAPLYTPDLLWGNAYPASGALLPIDRDPFLPAAMNFRADDLFAGGQNLCLMALDENDCLYMYLEGEEVLRLKPQHDPASGPILTTPTFAKTDEYGAIDEILTEQDEIFGRRILLKTKENGYYLCGYLESHPESNLPVFVDPQPFDCSGLPDGTELYPISGGILAVTPEGENLYRGNAMYLNDADYLPHALEQFLPAENVTWKTFIK